MKTTEITNLLEIQAEFEETDTNERGFINRRLFYYTCRSSTVMFVAAVNIIIDPEGEVVFSDWAAYCDSVPGQNHHLEYKTVAKMGNKVSKQEAEIFFPYLTQFFIDYRS